jgi:hypothetical protein
MGGRRWTAFLGPGFGKGSDESEPAEAEAEAEAKAALSVPPDNPECDDSLTLLSACEPSLPDASATEDPDGPGSSSDPERATTGTLGLWGCGFGERRYPACIEVGRDSPLPPLPLGKGVVASVDVVSVVGREDEGGEEEEEADPRRFCELASEAARRGTGVGGEMCASSIDPSLLWRSVTGVSYPDVPPSDGVVRGTVGEGSSEGRVGTLGLLFVRIGLGARMLESVSGGASASHLITSPASLLDMRHTRPVQAMVLPNTDAVSVHRNAQTRSSACTTIHNPIDGGGNVNATSAWVTVQALERGGKRGTNLSGRVGRADQTRRPPCLVFATCGRRPLGVCVHRSAQVASTAERRGRAVRSSAVAARGARGRRGGRG